MDSFLSDFTHECDMRFINLNQINKQKRIQKYIQEEDPLFALFKRFYENPDKRKNILYGNTESEIRLENLKDEHYSWDVFEIVIFLPICHYQKLTPGDYDFSMIGDDIDSPFKPKEEGYNALRMEKKMLSHSFRNSVREKIEFVVYTIMKSGRDVNQDLRRKAMQDVNFKFNQEDAIKLFCGCSIFTNYENYLYPGYSTIVDRINKCYADALENKTDIKDIDWAAWILKEKNNEELQICSVLNAECINRTINSVLKKNAGEESDIETVIIRDEDEKILGGVSSIKNVFTDNAENEIEQVKKLRFIRYPRGNSKNDQNLSKSGQKHSK